MILAIDTMMTLSRCFKAYVSGSFVLNQALHRDRQDGSIGSAI
jgi:hypothetical protein